MWEISFPNTPASISNRMSDPGIMNEVPLSVLVLRRKYKLSDQHLS